MSILPAPNRAKNANWITQAFFVPTRAGGAGQQLSNPFTTAAMKFYDTTPGGNKSINPKSQFTRYCDPRKPSLAIGSKGMGSYYSAAYDDNATRISLRFGVPKYNSLSSFISGYHDAGLAHLVNTGEAKSGIFSAYGIGKALATLYTLPLQAYFGLSYLYTRTTSFLEGRPYSKFYYMQPTMPLYWSAANTLLNQLAVDMGLVHGYTASDLSGTNATGKPDGGLSDNDRTRLNAILPDVFKDADDNSVIDLKAISSRAQRLQNQYQEAMESIANNTSLDAESFAKKVQEKLTINSLSGSNTKSVDLETYMKAYQNSPMGETTATDETVSETEAQDTENKETTIRLKEPGLKSLLRAELREGSAFITYEVDYNGSIGESFSNSTKESAISSTINSASSTARDTYVNFAGGNLGDGLISSAVESTVGMVADFITGAASAVGLGGLASLGGSAFVDIPDVWDQATAELPTESYKIRLSTPYGNKMSIFMKIYLPLIGLLAGALPRSTGKASYSSPFLCSLHSQGRNDIKMGIIDSIQIERGVSNIGFSGQGLPTAVDVTISIKSLDKIMHVPVTDSLLDTVTSFSHFDEDSALTTYISTLAGMDLYDQFYLAPRLSRAWAKTSADWSSFTSPSYFAQYAANTIPGQLLSSIMHSSSALKSGI